MNPNPDHSYSRYGQLRSPARRLPGYDIENVRVAWASAPTATGNYNTIADIQAGQFWYFYKEHGTSIVRLHNIEFYDWALGGSLAETDKYVLNPFTGHSFMDDVRTAQDNKPVEQYYYGWDRTYSNRLQYDSRETRQVEVQYDGFIQETVWNGPWDLRGGWYCEREGIDTSIPQVSNLSRAIEPGVLRVGARVAGGAGNNFVALNGGRAFWKMDEGMFPSGKWGWLPELELPEERVITEEDLRPTEEACAKHRAYAFAAGAGAGMVLFAGLCGGGGVATIPAIIISAAIGAYVGYSTYMLTSPDAPDVRHRWIVWYEDTATITVSKQSVSLVGENNGCPDKVAIVKVKTKFIADGGSGSGPSLAYVLRIAQSNSPTIEDSPEAGRIAKDFQGACRTSQTAGVAYSMSMTGSFNALKSIYSKDKYIDGAGFDKVGTYTRHYTITESGVESNGGAYITADDNKGSFRIVQRSENGGYTVHESHGNSGSYTSTTYRN